MAARAPRKEAGLNQTLKELSISSARTPKSAAPPGSWEEEASTASTPTSPSTPVQDFTPGPPPPTPMSPSQRHGNSTDWASFPASPAPRNNLRDSLVPDRLEKRPEKSSATAGRMIAGALGVKGPKMTEEQRQYERVVREKERKRLENEKEEGRAREREKEEAMKAVWDD